MTLCGYPHALCVYFWNLWEVGRALTILGLIINVFVKFNVEESNIHTYCYAPRARTLQHAAFMVRWNTFLAFLESDLLICLHR